MVQQRVTNISNSASKIMRADRKLELSTRLTCVPLPEAGAPAIINCKPLLRTIMQCFAHNKEQQLQFNTQN
jgi:hypothetical protein